MWRNEEVKDLQARKTVMTIKNSILGFVCILSLTAMADQRITFARQFQGGSRGTFGCDCYSMHKTGPGKVVWYPSAACWIDSLDVSRTSKVWAIMPLRRVAQSATPLAWHCSQKPGLAELEPSTRYQVQYIGASAGPDTAFEGYVENVFDFDAGDMFAWFGRDASSPLTCLLGTDVSSRKNGDGILCSSGRIGIDGGCAVLMYGLTVFRSGKVSLAFSVNGLTDIVLYNFAVKDGKVLDMSGRPIGSSPTFHTSSPALSIRMSEPEVISVRISRDYNVLKKIESKDSDINISLKNLRGILEWMSKTSEPCGAWQSTEECSLGERRIF